MKGRRATRNGEPPRRAGIAIPRVLVVDNLPLVRRGICRMLESLYSTTTAASGVEALGLIRSGERFDAVVSDLSMPEMSGLDLYLALVREHPYHAARFVFSTARPDILLGMSALATTEIRLLVKPYSGDALRAAVERVVEAGQSPP
jgi:CheY-like chemotaxis protein